MNDARGKSLARCYYELTPARGLGFGAEPRFAHGPQWWKLPFKT
jgi:hypothetical protein